MGRSAGPHRPVPVAGRQAEAVDLRHSGQGAEVHAAPRLRPVGHHPGWGTRVRLRRVHHEHRHVVPSCRRRCHVPGAAVVRGDHRRAGTCRPAGPGPAGSAADRSAGRGGQHRPGPVGGLVQLGGRVRGAASRDGPVLRPAQAPVGRRRRGGHLAVLQDQGHLRRHIRRRARRHGGAGLRHRPHPHRQPRQWRATARARGHPAAVVRVEQVRRRGDYKHYQRHQSRDLAPVLPASAPPQLPVGKPALLAAASLPTVRDELAARHDRKATVPPSSGEPGGRR